MTILQRKEGRKEGVNVKVNTTRSDTSMGVDADKIKE
jgi:hypothetical protein